MKINNAAVVNAYASLKHKEKGLTHQVVADRMGMSRPLVTHVLNNKKEATVDFMHAFEAAFKIKLNDYKKVIVLPLAEVPTAEFQEFAVSTMVDMQAMLIAIVQHLGIDVPGMAIKNKKQVKKK